MRNTVPKGAAEARILSNAGTSRGTPERAASPPLLRWVVAAIEPPFLSVAPRLMASESTQLAVLGAGPWGYAAAFYAADLGMQVTLIDEEKNPGGVCLYRGCRRGRTDRRGCAGCGDGGDRRRHEADYPPAPDSFRDADGERGSLFRAEHARLQTETKITVNCQNQLRLTKET